MIMQRHCTGNQADLLQLDSMQVGRVAGTLTLSVQHDQRSVDCLQCHQTGVSSSEALQ